MREIESLLPEWPPPAIRSTQPLIDTPPDARTELIAVLPARDEEDMIGAALSALAGQRDQSGRAIDPARFEVLVLANNCRDQTALVARQAAQSYPGLRLHVAERAFPDETAHIGTARRVLMDEAARRLRLIGRGCGVIASTDADTVVDPTWISATLAEVARGADVVGGRIVVDAKGRAAWSRGTGAYHLADVGYRSLASELAAYLDPDPWDPWPRHFQHFGPSLAVTVDAYQRAGGLPVRSALEDVALYAALRRIDARIRHSPHVRVITSARPSNRTAFGFAAQLQLWSAMHANHEPYLVEAPGALEARYHARSRLRAAWRRARISGGLPRHDIDRLAHDLGVSRGWLVQTLSLPQTFGCLLEQIEAMQAGSGISSACWPKVEIGQAIRELRLRLKPLRQQSSGTRTLEQVETIDLLTAAG